MASNNQINNPVNPTPTASYLSAWDANKNLSANNHIEGYATTATAASTTTLTVASAYQQFFTGSTTQTVLMPVTGTLALGQSYYIVNNSSGNVTVQSSGANNIQVMAPGTTLLLTCILTSGTTASSWNGEYAFNGGEGSGTVNSGTANDLAYYATTGTAVSGLTTVNSAGLLTNGSGVPGWIAYTGTGAPVLGTAPTITTPNIIGITTGGNAAAGSVGEFVMSQVLYASAIASTGVNQNLTSISLNAGDWDVWGNIFVVCSAIPNFIQGWVSSVSATAPDTSLISAIGATISSGSQIGLSVPMQRFNLSTTTSIYVSAYVSLTTGSATICGYISARRRR